MEKGQTEVDRSQELETFLRKTEIDLKITPGVKRKHRQTEKEEVETLTLDFPGSYDDTPDSYQLVITKPKKGGTIKTELIHTRRELNPGVDVENISQRVIFETRHKTLGGKISVRAVKGADDLVGTKPIYVDTNTPHFRYLDVKDPFALAQNIMARFKKSVSTSTGQSG